MRNNDESLLRIGPVEEYCAPEIPKLEETRDKVALLKKLPSRWQKNAKVVACIGLAGALTLSGCAHYLRSQYNAVDNITHSQESGYEAFQNQEEFDLVVRLHGGGAGSLFYVVHMTEQEVIGIIRNLLEAAGLNFDADPPDYIVDFVDSGLARGLPTHDIELFDEERGVAISHISWEDNHRRFFSHGGGGLAERVTERFARQSSGITFGVFHNPGRTVNRGWVARTADGLTLRDPFGRREAQKRAILEESVTRQVDEFIAFLQSEGILPAQEVIILRNGVPMVLDANPVLLNGCIMVPLHTFFEGLGMRVDWDDERQGLRVFAEKDGIEVEVGRWSRRERHHININDERIELDTHIIVNNNRVLIPLIPIAEAFGATVDWDRATNTANIILS